MQHRKVGKYECEPFYRVQLSRVAVNPIETRGASEGEEGPMRGDVQQAHKVGGPDEVGECLWVGELKVIGLYGVGCKKW